VASEAVAFLVQYLRDDGRWTGSSHGTVHVAFHWSWRSLAGSAWQAVAAPEAFAGLISGADVVRTASCT